MWTLSFYAFLLLGGYLLLSAMRFGIPGMVSDTYYQLQGCTGSEVIGDNKKGNYGIVFTIIMLAVAFLMMVCLLDSGKGIQYLAFLGCAGLAFVAVAPNYIDKDELPIHKGGAIVAAIGCVGWCMSVDLLPTVIIALIYILSLIKVNVRHPWYWLEIAGFVDVFVTYWTCV